MYHSIRRNLCYASNDVVIDTQIRRKTPIIRRGKTTILSNNLAQVTNRLQLRYTINIDECMQIVTGYTGYTGYRYSKNYRKL